MQGVEVWIPIIGILAPMTMVVLVVYAIARSRQTQAKYRAEVQAKMVEKFGSASEFTEFLSSPAGKEFVSEFQAAPAYTAHKRILAGVTWSLVLSTVGVALLVIRALGEDRDLIVPGAIFLGLGIALAVATIISYRLSRAWGLIKPADTTNVSLPNATS